MSKLKQKTVDVLRDLAIQYESTDLEIACDLMRVAHEARPNGPFIREKLNEYSTRLNPPNNSASALKLQKLVREGKVAIIPIGFRCFTKVEISNLLEISQPSLPFDSGFFPPYSVANVINNPLIKMDFLNKESQTVCIKYEAYKDPVLGDGIKFQKSSYDEIDSLVVSKDMKDINMYVDSTFGYYTLDLKHNFVLAHYNWHKFSDPNKSRGCTDPLVNLQNINNILNNRIRRMFDLCEVAENIFFIYHMAGNYNHMSIDDKHFDLQDLTPIRVAVNEKFKAQSFVITTDEIINADNILKMMQ